MHLYFIHVKKYCLLMLAIGVLVSALMPKPVIAEERQYKVEAAFLYSFFNYITWPKQDSPHGLEQPVICVYGPDPILPYLKYIQLKVAAERELIVRTVAEDENAGGCNILFMRHRISARILASLPGSVLTVFKPDDPLDRGGMVELSEDEDRISIKINQAQLERNGFVVSSRLLDLAQVSR